MTRRADRQSRVAPSTDAIPPSITMWVAMAELPCPCFRSLTRQAEEETNQRKNVKVSIDMEQVARSNCTKSTRAHPQPSFMSTWQENKRFLRYARGIQTDIQRFLAFIERLLLLLLLLLVSVFYKLKKHVKLKIHYYT